MDHGEVLAAQDEQVDRLLVPVTALLALSVVIALLGIANTLALCIHERIRELGPLRALGMARGQLRLMVRSEAVIIAALGAVLGVVVALFVGWALVAGPCGTSASPSWSSPARSCCGWPPSPPSPAWSPPSSPPAGRRHSRCSRHHRRLVP
jgi:ABC-type antimicrobial peptide transport system permease subunit